VSTLVVCLHRGERLPDVDPPVVGRDAVESLVTRVGVDDPEDSRVNCLLEGLRVAEDVEDATIAVISGPGEAVAADREVARQMDLLVTEYDPDGAVVVVDSAEDERLVPIIESRVTVDAVDRVVVRQARDIESTYYLLKQFLADEQLRKTVLVPFGAALVAFPILLFVANSPTMAVGAIAAAVGVYLLYKGLGIDTYLARLPAEIQNAMYSGQVSLVTYVVAAGLALVGIFAGVLGISTMDTSEVGEVIVAMRFGYDSIPWVTAAALAASTGRLLDEIIRDDTLGSAYVNLPFIAIAVGLAIRGFSVYFLERSGVFEEVALPPTEVGPVTLDGITLSSGSHLAVFILASILISLVGVRVAAYVSSTDVEVELDEPGT
jgi:putative membrane protein